MTAISSAIMGFIQHSDVICYLKVYSCSDSFIRFLQKFGVDIHFVDATNLDEVKEVFEKHDNICARERYRSRI